jgi:hypothetical protein
MMIVYEMLTLTDWFDIQWHERRCGETQGVITGLEPREDSAQKDESWCAT